MPFAVHTIREVKLALVLYCLLSALTASAQTRHEITISSAGAHTAGIDGREWDSTFPGATTVDAVHRSVLVRFPGFAELIRSKLHAGLRIVKAELVLEYDGYEVAPDGYLVRNALGEARWKADPPRWHVVAWPLRKPWIADKTHGPTFNAHINGMAFWTQYGAADSGTDRYASRLGPAELSFAHREARFDLTPSLTAADAGARLRAVEEQGFLLQKLETYDTRYRDADNAYEWAVPTGGHGLRFRNPKVVVTLVPAAESASASTSLPPPTDLQALLGKGSRLTGLDREPTLRWPSSDQLKSLAQRAAGVWPEKGTWQHQRLMELYRVGGDGVTPWMKAADAGDYKAYQRLVRSVLATPPRYWKGWEIQDDLLIWHLYRDLLPHYVQDHVKRYWASWLMPDVPTSELLHPQSAATTAYWKRTQDWRGRASFFRAGYNYATSTQNFNHMAAMGALLGGAVIGSEYAIADGRHGLEHYPLRLWTMLDGSSQEMLDHYYFSITLSAQKMFADFGPTRLDRLMGQVILDRSIEMLATAYHPNLKRLVHPSGRARLSGILVEQDGIYGVLHTLSRRGTLNYLEQPFEGKVHGMPVWGHDFPPGRVAAQALVRPWGLEWIGSVIDDKRFPFEETSVETTRGAYTPPLWRRMYLGRYYGLASQDIKGGTVDIIAQWSREAKPASTLEDLGTLTLRYAVNTPDMATTAGGVMPSAGGIATFQHRNRAIVCTKPRGQKEHIVALAGPHGLRSLATVIALWNFKKQPDWEIHVDGRAITALPTKIKAGQVITIKDGVSYLAIIPLPAADLGRTDEVVIGFGGGGKSEPNGTPIAPALTVSSYNLLSEHPVDAKLDWPRIGASTYGGFVIELGDETEHGSFEAFMTRMRANRLSTRWMSAKRLLHVEYRSGKDIMEVGCATDYPQSDVHYPVPPGQHTRVMPYRRINGGWPYLAPGIERDTSISQEGTTGRLEKNGAVLVTDKGRKAYLQAEPATGTYVAYNPLPDPTRWSLTVPGGATVTANGKVGLLKVTVQPSSSNVAVDYALKDDQNGPGMATELIVAGLAVPPRVVLNGEVLPPPAKAGRGSRMNGYVIPLGTTAATR